MYIRERSPLWYARKYAKPAVAVITISALTATACVFANEKEAVKQMPKSKAEIVAEANFKAYTWDVPLEEDLQKYIVELADRYNLEPELILAVIGQESNFKPDAVGDGGDSIGLMQVQEKHHEARIKSLGVTDLEEPYQNVLVGTDYLAECIGKGSVEYGLMSYNGGKAYADEMLATGQVSDYAEGVMILADLLKGGN